MMRAVALVALLAFVGSASAFTNTTGCYDANGQIKGAFVQDVGCLCDTGYSDGSNGITECNVQGNGVDICDIPALTLLDSENAVSFQSAAYNAGNINFDVKVTPAVNRRVLSVYFGNSTFATGCGYPDGTFTRSVNNNCEDSYTVTVPGEAVPACGYSVDSSDASYFKYRSNLNVVVAETLGSFRGQDIVRYSNRVRKFVLQAPKSVRATNTVFVVSPVNVKAAITGNRIGGGDDLTGEITLTVQVQDPYQLFTKVQNIQFGNTNLVLNAAGIVDDNSGCAQSGPCNKILTIPFTRGGDVCNVDSTFSVTFQVGCRSGVTDCPLSGGEESVVSGSFAADEDVCFVATTDATVDPILSFHNNDFTAPRVAFLLDEDIFIQVDITADIGIASATITDVSILDGPFVGSVEFNSISGNAEQLRASFVYASSNLGRNADDALLNVTVAVDIALTYDAGRRRGLNEDKLSVRSTVVVVPQKRASITIDDSSSAGRVAPVVVGAAAVAGATYLAL